MPNLFLLLAHHPPSDNIKLAAGQFATQRTSGMLGVSQGSFYL